MKKADSSETAPELVEIEALGADEWLHVKRTAKLRRPELADLVRRATRSMPPPRRERELHSCAALPTSPAPTRPIARAAVALAHPFRTGNLVRVLVLVVVASGTHVDTRSSRDRAPGSLVPNADDARIPAREEEPRSVSAREQPSVPAPALVVHVPVRGGQQEALDTTAARNRSRARAAYRVGNQRMFAGDFAGARRAYRRATRLDPLYGAGYRGLGIASAKLGHNARARRAFRQYVKLLPNADDVSLIEAWIARLR